MTLLQMQGMSVRHGQDPALSDVNFAIETGEIVTIVGPNGSGKSTMLKTMIGAVRPSSGRIDRQKGLRIGYVPQKLHIDPTLPLNVDRFLSLPNPASRAKRDAALLRAGVPDLAMRQMSGLSGGQLQRVLLARAILHEPQLLLLDEATQGLDQRGSAEFYRRIEEVRRDLGCAVVMVSHELHVVMSASDRVICLNGHVCCEGRPEVVASAPEYRALFGSGTGGALALYRHEHDHAHDSDHHHDHQHGSDCIHDHGIGQDHNHKHGVTE
ncbi:metal ABC transporter ATP-binding protein [Marinovum sp. 2_MG-2023]|uniref:metal ABC transporter ATP-binding protein n=1 Tax=unclassified Marinovum TaxID=2647166 RepID=UPI0026E213DA|nr:MULTISPECIES: metal ABC transporter ATP-binding protein [unclassified Marinovum]MDO6728612.1 metal ABC transporter ATP-binding protein [Marinovum sp. 2_MG-2023]MDO6777972.1 metal ABC transporter ATP-binding protein [Marinovum sp. 1_MG-2023]